MTLRNFLPVLLSFSGILFCSFTGEYLPVPSQNLVSHTYYELSYNESCEEANWVYYVLTDSMVLNNGEQRTDRFKTDNLVPGGSAKTSDYTKSGYDRGHLCPAADMGFNKLAMEESFLMSNVTPQTPEFNRGIWKELETDVREWAVKEHRLIVVAGPVFKDNKGTIGKDKVVVPGYFFKIVFDNSGTPRMIAFIIPNEKTDRPVTDFAVPVDKVEEMTGFDFFSQLPDNEENQLESKVVLAGWFKGFEEPVVAAKNNAPKPESTGGEDHFYLYLIFAIAVIILIVYLTGRKKR